MKFKDARVLAENQRRNGPPTSQSVVAEALIEFVGRAEVAEGRVWELEREIGSARAIARVLAHAYEEDTRPPQHMVAEAIAFSVDQRGEGEA